MHKYKILLLGVNGFIGSNLFKNLSDKYLVYCASITIENSELQELVSKSDIIIHSIGVTKSQMENDFFKINIDFSFKLFTILCNYEKKKLIYFSSIHYHRNDLYGFSKRYNEYLFSKEEFITKNQSFIIRTPGIFGPGSKPNNVSVVSTFCYNIVNKIQSKITDPEKVLEIYYIDDLVSEINNLFENNKHYNVIQLNSEQITVKQLFKLIKDISINNFSAIDKLYSTNFIDNITKTYNSFKYVTK